MSALSPQSPCCWPLMFQFTLVILLCLGPQLVIAGSHLPGYRVGTKRILCE